MIVIFVIRGGKITILLLTLYLFLQIRYFDSLFLQNRSTDWTKISTKMFSYIFICLNNNRKDVLWRGREGFSPPVGCWFNFMIVNSLLINLHILLRYPTPKPNGAPSGIKISGYLCTVGNNVVVLIPIGAPLEKNLGVGYLNKICKFISRQFTIWKLNQHPTEGKKTLSTSPKDKNCYFNI